MENEQIEEFESSNGVASEHNKQYIATLINEREHLDPSLVNTARLLDQEISQAQTGHEKVKLLELHNDKPTKVVIKVKVPADEFPKFNFIGKIIGPKGNSLRRMQEETECRMAVFGRGSMRDKDKEEELRVQGGKYAHLNDELHVHVETFGHPIDVYRRISFALHELRRHLVPDYNDEVTQEQVQMMAALNGTNPPVAKRGRGRGGVTMPRGGAVPVPYGVRGRGAGSFGIGAARGRGLSRGTRGAGTLGQGAGLTGWQKPTQQLAQSALKQPQAMQSGYPYEQDAGIEEQDFDNQSAVGSAGQYSEFGQSNTAQPSYAGHSGQSTFNSQNAAVGFNQQANAPYNSMTSDAWGVTSGVEAGGFGKTPLGRSSIGQIRAHPYAPPAGRGGQY